MLDSVSLFHQTRCNFSVQQYFLHYPVLEEMSKNELIMQS